MNKIVFTGGGSAGHVTPNIAIMGYFIKKGWEVHYIGTEDGIEKGLISKIPNVTYHAISAGKLRRYLSVENLKDPFKVIKGIFEAKKIIKSIKPDVVFSKGGFVSVPVVMGAKFNGVPAVTHECDFTPGLANKLAIPFCKKVCVTFPDTLKHLKGQKGICTGTPIRKEILEGIADKGYKTCRLTKDKPVILIVGGSLGAQKINQTIRKILKKILKDFNVVHICGKNNVDQSFEGVDGYRQYEYLNKELPDVFAMASVIVSRAGANSIFEFLALNKPNLLIPLPLSASRGDQILNARYFEEKGYSKVLMQENMTEELLLSSINELYSQRQKYIDKMKNDSNTDSVKKIIDVILDTCIKR